MTKRNLKGAARVAFAKELISLSQEVQQLSAQLARTWDKYLYPGAEFRNEAPADEAGMLEMLSRATANQLHELRSVLKKSGENVKKGSGFFVE